MSMLWRWGGQCCLVPRLLVSLTLSMALRMSLKVGAVWYSKLFPARLHRPVVDQGQAARGRAGVLNTGSVRDAGTWLSPVQSAWLLRENLLECLVPLCSTRERLNHSPRGAFEGGRLSSFAVGAARGRDREVAVGVCGCRKAFVSGQYCPLGMAGVSAASLRPQSEWPQQILTRVATWGMPGWPG